METNIIKYFVKSFATAAVIVTSFFFGKSALVQVIPRPCFIVDDVVFLNETNVLLKWTGLKYSLYRVEGSKDLKTWEERGAAFEGLNSIAVGATNTSLTLQVNAFDPTTNLNSICRFVLSPTNYINEQISFVYTDTLPINTITYFWRIREQN